MLDQQLLKTSVAIVGGGVSGVSCALNLLARGICDFTLISPEIGGKVKSSIDGAVNYGAYYMRRDYHHIMRLAEPTRRIGLRDISVDCNGDIRPLTSMFWRHPWASLRLMTELLRFNRHYQRFKRLASHRCMKEIIEEDKYLHDLYREPALDWLRRVGLRSLEIYVRPMITATAMAKLDQVSSAVMLDCFLVALYPTFEFVMPWQRIVEPFRKQIISDSVIRMSHANGTSYLSTSGGRTVAAQHVVLAVPLNVAAQLIEIPYNEDGARHCYVWHLKGQPKPQHRRTHFFIFGDESPDIVIANQRDGTSLFLSSDQNADYTRHFDGAELIHFQKWEPAFHLDTRLMPTQYRENVTFIGDHNAVGMEDCYLGGQFAAKLVSERLSSVLPALGEQDILPATRVGRTAL